MSGVRTWAGWSIFVLCALLSPVIAFLLLIAVEIVLGSVIDAGTPALVLVGAGTSGLLLFRKLRAHPRRAASEIAC
jgi:hypothetical protein